MPGLCVLTHSEFNFWQAAKWWSRITRCRVIESNGIKNGHGKRINDSLKILAFDNWQIMMLLLVIISSQCGEVSVLRLGYSNWSWFGLQHCLHGYQMCWSLYRYGGNFSEDAEFWFLYRSTVSLCFLVLLIRTELTIKTGLRTTADRD